MDGGAQDGAMNGRDAGRGLRKGAAGQLVLEPAHLRRGAVTFVVTRGDPEYDRRLGGRIHVGRVQVGRRHDARRLRTDVHAYERQLPFAAYKCSFRKGRRRAYDHDR